MRFHETSPSAFPQGGSNDQSRGEILREILAIQDWRHPYDLGDGGRVVLAQPWFERWHAWRLGIDAPNLEKIVGGIRGRTILDLGCCDGFYGLHHARAGAERVLGIDGREEHVRRARLLSRYYGLDNTAYRLGDVETCLDSLEERPFDVVLMYGLLYHLCNPIGTLRAIRRLTGRVLAIQTFMNDSPEPVLYLHDDDVRQPGSGLFSLVCRPTQAALARILASVGFPLVLRVCPRPYFTDPAARHSRQRHLGFFYAIDGTPEELAAIQSALGVKDRLVPELPETQIVRIDAATPPLVPDFGAT